MTVEDRIDDACRELRHRVARVETMGWSQRPHDRRYALAELHNAQQRLDAALDLLDIR